MDEDALVDFLRSRGLPVDEDDVFQLLRARLEVEVTDRSEGPACGGEDPGRLGVRVRLLWARGGKTTVISESTTYLG